MAVPPDHLKRAARCGLDWALALSEALLRDGRIVEGGFPGTLSEARMRALGDFEPDDLIEPQGSEIVRVVYTSARAGWSKSCRSQLRSGPA